MPFILTAEALGGACFISPINKFKAFLISILLGIYAYVVKSSNNFSHDDSSIDDFTASVYLKQAVEMCSKSYVQRTE